MVKINGEMVKAELTCSHSHAAYTDLKIIAKQEFYNVKQAVGKNGAVFLSVFDLYLLFKFFNFLNRKNHRPKLFRLPIKHG